MNKTKSKIKVSLKDRTFEMTITLILLLFAFATMVPLISEVAISFSSKSASDTNSIGLLPVEFTLDSWKYMLSQASLWKSFAISVSTTIISVVSALFINVLMAYPLSKKDFKPQKILMLFVVFTMVFKAPTVPYYLTIRNLGLVNNYWVMVLPQILYAYNLIIMRTFFMQFPKEVEEAAEIDGCGKFRMLFNIIIPSSKAVLATEALFYGVSAWNQYQTPLMFIQDVNLFPLQLKIKQILNSGGDLQAITRLKDVNYSTETLGAVAVIFAVIPVLIVYPFIQKHFAKGAMLGSVKG